MLASEVSNKIPHACKSQLPNGVACPASSLSSRLICRSLICSARLPSQDLDAKLDEVLQVESCSALAEENILQEKPVPGFPLYLGVTSRKGPLLQKEEKGGQAKGVNSCVLHGEDPQNSMAHTHCRP